MAYVGVNFQHPTNGKVFSVALDDTIKGQKALAN